MLKELNSEHLDGREEIALFDEASGRLFLLSHLTTVADGVGSWAASELVPDIGCGGEPGEAIPWIGAQHVPPSVVRSRLSQLPTDADGVEYSRIDILSECPHPFLAKVDAIAVIRRAIEEDQWAISHDSVRANALDGGGTITVEAEKALAVAPGRSQILAVIEAAQRARGEHEQRVRCCEDGFLIEIFGGEGGYPTNIQLCVVLDNEGFCPAENPAFSLPPFHELADELAGRAVTHFHAVDLFPIDISSAGEATGPGMLALCDLMARDDQIYARVVLAGKNYCVWGPRQGGELRAKEYPVDVAEKHVSDKAGSYEYIGPELVPGFLGRVLGAIEYEEERRSGIG